MRKRKKLAALAVAGLTTAAVAATPGSAQAGYYEYCLAAAFEGQPEICFGGSSCNDRDPRLKTVWTIQDKYLGGPPMCPMS